MITGIKSTGSPTLVTQGDQIRIDVEFSSISESVVNVRSEKTATHTGRWWYAYAIDQVMGREVIIEHDDSAGRVHRFRSNLFQSWWALSDDTVNWKPLNESDLTDTEFTSALSRPWPGGRIYVAHYPMYPHKRTLRKVRQWTADPSTQPTASGNAAYEIGRMTERIEPFEDRVVPDLPCYGIHRPAEQESSNVLVCTVGVHSGETMGTWVFEGFVDALLFSQEAWAQGLRQYWDIYVYPTIDPQQQIAGYFRSTPEDPSFSMNRNWDTGNVETYEIHRTAWGIDLPPHVDVIIDHHNHHGESSWFYYRYNNQMHVDFEEAVGSYGPALPSSPKSFGSASTLTGYFEQNHLREDGFLRLTMEGDPTASSVQDYLTLGAAQARALWDRTVAGDFSHGPNN